MKVVKNGKTVSLTDNDFLSSGGEGSVYIKNGEVYKIFTNSVDPSFIQKMKELDVLNNPNILKPVTPLFNDKDVFVGFTMKFVDDTASLPLLFTTSYRDRNGITEESTVKLVENIAQTMQFVHDQKILIVDANEFNYLVDKASYTTPYFIDVDSYQTPSFPAKVIMPSIRDFTTTNFSTLSDWYSFAVVSFQLFTGIHPYKGSHPDFKKDDIETRCKKHVSVLNKAVRFPPVVRSFDLIPDNYRQWYEEVFEKGLRKLPPTIAGKIIAHAQQTPIASKLKVTEVFDFREKINKVRVSPTANVIQGITKYRIGNNDYKYQASKSEIVLFENEPVELFINQDRLKAFYRNELIDSGVAASKFSVIDGRIYVLGSDKITEIKFEKFKSLMMLPVNSWNIIERSSQMFKNCFYSNMLGAAYFYIPFSTKNCAELHMKSLDGYKILDAAYDHGTLIVMTFKNHVYSRFTIKFMDETFIYTDEVVEKDVTLAEINFTTLDNGVSLLLADDDIQITVAKSTDKKIISSVGLPLDIILENDGNSVYYYQGTKLYRMKMN